jgi:hypothetical protein
MPVTVMRPTPDELLGVSVETEWLSVNDQQPESTTIHLNAGELRNGAAIFCIHLSDNEYGRMMKEAIVEAVGRVNAKFRQG